MCATGVDAVYVCFTGTMMGLWGASANGMHIYVMYICTHHRRLSVSACRALKVPSFPDTTHTAGRQVTPKHPNHHASTNIFRGIYIHVKDAQRAGDDLLKLVGAKGLLWEEAHRDVEVHPVPRGLGKDELVDAFLKR